MNTEPAGRPQQPKEEQKDQANKAGFKYRTLLRYISLLIILAAAFWIKNPFSREDQIYSLARSDKFPIVRVTSNIFLQYYVDKKFMMEMGPQKTKLREDLQLEESIEKKYIAKLETRCVKMIEKRESLKKMADFSHDQKDKENYLKQAKALDTSPCDTYNDFQLKYPQLFKPEKI